MARPIRLEFPGALFHVTARGNEKRNIFRDDRDRRSFLRLLGIGVKRFGWILPAYALMPNHVHLVIQLTIETLSKGMHWLNGTYAQRFNQRYGRVGHLFQGRFDAQLVEKEVHFLEVARYVVLNPVRAMMVARPEEYEWTSYRAVIGSSAAPRWLAVDDLLVQFGPDLDLARAAYESFVSAAIGIQSTLWKALVGGVYLGSEAWQAEVRERIKLKPRADDHPRAQRLVGAPPMATIVAAVAEAFVTSEDRVRSGMERQPRMAAAWIGWNEALLTGAEIAAGLRLRSSGHVSALVRRCDREVDDDSRLRDNIDRCLATIRRKSRIEDLTPNSSS